MITVSRDFDLTSHNTFGMRVKCACFVEYDAPSDLEAIYTDVSLPRPFLHIGGGSNLLFTGDYAGTVLHSRISGLDSRAVGDYVEFTVGSGVDFDEVCREAARRGLWGLENLSGIPGEAGAAAVQNIGAYGMEIKDVLVKVDCFDTRECKHISMEAPECGYAYRYSMFKAPENRGRYVITSVTLRLGTKAAPKLGYGHLADEVRGTAPEDVRDAVLRIRDAKLPDPAKVGSAGSFFKNPVVSQTTFYHVCNVAAVTGVPASSIPHFSAGDGQVKIPAAWLIDSCGWKGVRRGNAAVWHLQPLVIVNVTGNASPDEILELENDIVSSVHDRYGIDLSPEVDHI